MLAVRAAGRAPAPRLPAARGHAVGVPHRHQGQRRLPLRGVRVPVGDPRAGRDALGEGDRRAHRHGRAQAVPGRVARPAGPDRRARCRAGRGRTRCRAARRSRRSWPGAAAPRSGRPSGRCRPPPRRRGPARRSSGASVRRRRRGGSTAPPRRSRRRARPGQRPTPARASPRCRPAPGQPRVGLEVHAGGGAAAPDGGDHLGQPPLRAHRDLHVGGQAAAKSVPGPCNQARTGAVIPAARSASASIQGRRREESAPPASAARAAGSSPCRTRRPSPPPSAGRPTRLAQHGRVGGDGVEVDDHLGPTGGASPPHPPRAATRDPRTRADRLRQPSHQVPGDERSPLGGPPARRGRAGGRRRRPPRRRAARWPGGHR
jgi:hypothetical protein